MAPYQSALERGARAKENPPACPVRLVLGSGSGPHPGLQLKIGRGAERSRRTGTCCSLRIFSHVGIPSNRRRRQPASAPARRHGDRERRDQPRFRGPCSRAETLGGDRRPTCSAGSTRQYLHRFLTAQPIQKALELRFIDQAEVVAGPPGLSVEQCRQVPDRGEEADREDMRIGRSLLLCRSRQRPRLREAAASNRA